MTEREKVIKGLECCEKKVCIFRDTEKDCPYWELCGEYDDAFKDCTTALAKDAIALLKAQEPRNVSDVFVAHEGKLGNCPACGAELMDYYNETHCGRCGQAVKWE